MKLILDWLQQVKLSLCTTWRYIGRAEVQLRSFLTSDLGVVSGQFHVPSALRPRKYPGTHWIGDWADPSLSITFFLTGLQYQILWKSDTQKSRWRQVTDGQAGRRGLHIGLVFCFVKKA
jgi:hypothetical protein